ncbi:MAG: hypothetical protein ACTSRP_05500 [Candidatus Helarchaeota archaeon]
MASKKAFRTLELRVLALSKTIMSLLEQIYLLRRPSRKCWNWISLSHWQAQCVSFPRSG